MFESISTDILSEEPEPQLELVPNWNPSNLDPRLSRTSYSSESLFHSCARKYQLTKLQGKSREVLDWKQSLTFSFGHLVGDAAQRLFMGETLDRVILHMFATWEEHLYQENDKQKKGFFYAMQAIEMLAAELEPGGALEDYELVYYEGKPAVELGLKIKYPDGGAYRGFVDLVLRNKSTGLYCIIDTKTDSGRVLNPNRYKNSGQALGYSVVLDKIEPGYSDYTVYYLVYMTYLERWELFEFPKTRTQRAIWLRDRLWDNAMRAAMAQEFGTYGIWPVNGNSCMAWNRECPFLGSCEGPTEYLMSPLAVPDLGEDDSQFTFIFELEELL